MGHCGFVVRQANQPRFGHAYRNREEQFRHRLRNFTVESHDGQRFGAAHGLAAAQSERGNIDARPAQHGSHSADYARHVMIAHVEERAFERRLDVDSVDAEQSRRRAVEHRAFHGNLCLLLRDRPVLP